MLQITKLAPTITLVRAVAQKEPTFEGHLHRTEKPDATSSCNNAPQFVNVNHLDANATAVRGIFVVLFVPKVKYPTLPREGAVHSHSGGCCAVRRVLCIPEGAEHSGGCCTFKRRDVNSGKCGIFRRELHNPEGA